MPIAFVPLDDRPVTLQLPVALGAIAGVPVAVPPAPLLGHYLKPGNPDGILAWLQAQFTAMVHTASSIASNGTEPARQTVIYLIAIIALGYLVTKITKAVAK